MQEKAGLPEINRHQTHSLQGRKGYPDGSPEQIDLWREVTHVQIKKPLKDRAVRISKGVSALLVGLLHCPRKNTCGNQVNGSYGLPMLICKDETCSHWSVKYPLIFSIMEQMLACQ